MAWLAREINYIAICGNPNVKASGKPKKVTDLYKLSIDQKKEVKEHKRMTPEEVELFGFRGHSIGDILRPNGGSGFNATFSGYYNHCFDAYGHKSYESHYWTSSQTESGKPILRIIGNEGVIGRLASICHMGSSVRYIKD